MEWVGELERAFAAAIYPNRVAIAIATAILIVTILVVARRRRWDRLVRRHPRSSAAAAVAALIVGLPLGWYLGSPLFLSTTVDEPAPVAAGATPRPRPAPGTGGPATPRPAPTSDVPATPGAMQLTGTFTGADEFHFGRGRATLIETAPGEYTLRLEDFEVRNGPDLYVYLSPSADGYVDGAIELGRLKADRGNQNYELPGGVDVAAARSVVIWCRAFSVEFAAAPLS